MADYGTKITEQPFQRFAAIAPSDTTPFVEPPESILVGGAGAITGIDMGGATVLLSGLLAGVVYHFKLAQIKATGTTATLLTALYK